MIKALEDIKAAVQAGDDDKVKTLVEEAVLEALTPREILEEAMMPAMEEIGRRFARGEAFIPELIVAAYAMETGMASLKARFEGKIKDRGKVVLGTVEGDIHSIGKNLVRMCLEGAGYEVVDLGEGVKTEKFVQAYMTMKPDILGLSALLSSTMLFMQKTIDAVRAVDPGARIIVGGTPITQEFADRIGASGYAPDAFAAVQCVRDLLKQEK
jgi:5-methyltetrahydrofolate--homocysteine methyltransferase